MAIIRNNWCVYLLKCSDESYYCGITNNITRRLSTHNSGQGAKYTRSKLPVELLISTKADMSRSEASIIEYTIKQLKRKDKINYIKGINENGNNK